MSVLATVISVWTGNQGIPILTTEFLADWFITCSLTPEFDFFLQEPIESASACMEKGVK